MGWPPSLFPLTLSSRRGGFHLISLSFCSRYTQCVCTHFKSRCFHGMRMVSSSKNELVLQTDRVLKLGAVVCLRKAYSSSVTGYTASYAAPFPSIRLASSSSSSSTSTSLSSCFSFSHSSPSSPSSCSFPSFPPLPPHHPPHPPQPLHSRSFTSFSPSFAPFRSPTPHTLGEKAEAYETIVKEEQFLPEENPSLYFNELCGKLDQLILQAEDSEELLQCIISHRGTFFVKNLITAITSLASMVEAACTSASPPLPFADAPATLKKGRNPPHPPRTSHTPQDLETLRKAPFLSAEGSYASFEEILKISDVLKRFNEEEVKREKDASYRAAEARRKIVNDERYHILLMDIYKFRHHLDSESAIRVLLSLKRLNHKQHTVINGMFYPVFGPPSSTASSFSHPPPPSAKPTHSFQPPPSHPPPPPPQPPLMESFPSPKEGIFSQLSPHSGGVAVPSSVSSTIITLPPQLVEESSFPPQLSPYKYELVSPPSSRYPPKRENFSISYPTPLHLDKQYALLGLLLECAKVYIWAGYSTHKFFDRLFAEKLVPLLMNTHTVATSRSSGRGVSSGYPQSLPCVDVEIDRGFKLSSTEEGYEAGESSSRIKQPRTYSNPLQARAESLKPTLSEGLPPQLSFLAKSILIKALKVFGSLKDSPPPSTPAFVYYTAKLIAEAMRSEASLPCVGTPHPSPFNTTAIPSPISLHQQAAQTFSPEDYTVICSSLASIAATQHTTPTYSTPPPLHHHSPHPSLGAHWVDTVMKLIAEVIVKDGGQNFTPLNLIVCVNAFKEARLQFNEVILLSCSLLAPYLQLAGRIRQRGELCFGGVDTVCAFLEGCTYFWNPEDTSLDYPQYRRGEGLSQFNYLERSPIIKLCSQALTYLEDYVDEISENGAIQAMYAVCAVELAGYHPYMTSLLYRRIGYGKVWEARKIEVFQLWLSQLIQFPWLTHNFPLRCCHEGLRSWCIQRGGYGAPYPMEIAEVSTLLNEVGVQHHTHVQVDGPYEIDISLRSPRDSKRVAILIVADAARNTHGACGGAALQGRHLSYKGYRVNYIYRKHWKTLDEAQKLQSIIKLAETI